MGINIRSLDLKDGNCQLITGLIVPQSGWCLMETLLEKVDWKQPEIQMFGRRLRPSRLSAWYGDPEAVYRYSGLVNWPLPWIQELLDLKIHLESHLPARFNSVLLNLYRDGNDAMGWHSDDEPELGLQPYIASVTLGESRRFCLRHRQDTQQTPVSIQLGHATVFIMQGSTQRHWKHALMKTRQSVKPRINLTYRYIQARDTG